MQLLIVLEAALQIDPPMTLYFANIFKLPVPLQNYFALFERQQFRRRSCGSGIHVTGTNF
jgi:hypothetical protein